MLTYQTSPQTLPLKGELTIPGDKSISHRALLLSALAEGNTHITGLSDALDVTNTRNALAQMGIVIQDIDQHTIKVTGHGLGGLKKPTQPIDLGNSGTAMRLLSGILVNQPFATTLIGDESLSKRPMRRIVDPLTQFGAQITATEKGTAPLHIAPSEKLQAIHYELPIASAQLKSSLMLAALYAKHSSTISETIATRDHTERLFRYFSIPCEKQGTVLTITPKTFKAVDSLQIPADISSAAFFIAAATLVPGSDLLLKQVGINPLRMGFINVLTKMGADIQIIPSHTHSFEPIADIRVRHAKLRAITVPSSEVVAMIDEFPMLFALAACSEGTTQVRGVEELRHKESDRLTVMAQALKKLNIAVEEFPDGLNIHGGQLTGGAVDSCGDHRIAMALSVAGLAATDILFVNDCDNVATSFPLFIKIAHQISMQVSTKES